jgi:phosphatidate cytidylyltransferase
LWVADIRSTDSALSARLSTSALLVPLIVSAILFLPTPLFALLAAVLILIASWEWARLGGADVASTRAAVVIAAGAAIALFWWWSPPTILLLLPACGWWIVFGFSLPRLRPQPRTDRGFEPLVIALGLLILLSLWFALVRLHGDGVYGPHWVLAFTMLVWAADSAAYFAGRRFGKRKLAPYVSPGKTREGVYAALAVTGLAVAVGAVFLGLDASSNLLLILLTLVTVSASVSGDLCESWLKRRRAIKDSGALLPGHGGMLDRIDSMTAAAPVFALGLTWLGLPT